jgi:hypothetical protein
MSQRDSGYARKERDLYETPEWVTNALIPHIANWVSSVWEPAAGNRRMANVLADWVADVNLYASDIEPAEDVWAGDFLSYRAPPIVGGLTTAIITNPPYDLALEFCEHALRLMEPTGGFVAMLLRTDFDHAKSRTHLFRDCPAFAKKLVLMKRIVWFVEDNGKPKASPSFNHAWYIWNWRHEGPPTIAYGP